MKADYLERHGGCFDWLRLLVRMTNESLDTLALPFLLIGASMNLTEKGRDANVTALPTQMITNQGKNQQDRGYAFCLSYDGCGNDEGKEVSVLLVRSG